MTYVKLVGVHLVPSRASRTNDVDLFVYALSEMCPVFFATSHHNYARWVVRYYLELINMEATHSGLKNMLKEGHSQYGDHQLHSQDRQWI